MFSKTKEENFKLKMIQALTWILLVFVIISVCNLNNVQVQQDVKNAVKTKTSNKEGGKLMTSIEVNQQSNLITQTANEALNAYRIRQNELTNDANRINEAYNNARIDVENRKIEVEWANNENDRLKAQAALSQAESALKQAEVAKKRQEQDALMIGAKITEAEASAKTAEAKRKEQKAKERQTDYSNVTQRIGLGTAIGGTVLGAGIGAVAKFFSKPTKQAVKTVTRIATADAGHYINYLDGFSPFFIIKPAYDAITRASQQDWTGNGKLPK